MLKKAYYTTLKLSPLSGGFTHNLCRLITGIRVATVSQRTFIIPPHLSVGWLHNTNLPTHKQLPDYLSLDKTQIAVDGKPQTFSYIRFDELSKKEVATWTVRHLFSSLHFDNNDPADLLIYVDGKMEEAQKNHVLSRRLADSPHAPYNNPALRESVNKVQLMLFPRQEYWQLAQEAAQALGGAGSYYAMHVRRGDRMRQAGADYDKATRPQAIIERIRDLVPQGANLYLMSDEPDEHFFDPLKRHWQLARYWDFPQLDRFVNQPNPLLVDNYALFLIEGLVYCQAKLNISTYRNHGIKALRYFFEPRPKAEIDKHYLIKKVTPSLSEGSKRVYAASATRQKYYAYLKCGRNTGGFIHNAIRLRKAIQAAVLSRRTLILPELFLSRAHNHLIPGIRHVYDYFSYQKTEITINGKQQSLAYKRLSELDREEMKGWKTKYIITGIQGAVNDAADLIVYIETEPKRKAAPYNFPSLCADSELRAGRKGIGEAPDNPLQIRFSPLPKYQRLAKKIVKSLGGERNYYALHVRRGDTASNWAGYDEATQCKTIIPFIQALVPQGATLYLMSDEPDEHFFDPLKRHWRLVRYWDFPQLERFVNQPNPLLVDNYALFLSEWLIYAQAKLSIATYKEHHINWFPLFLSCCDQEHENRRFLYEHSLRGTRLDALKSGGQHLAPRRQGAPAAHLKTPKSGGQHQNLD